MSETSAPELGNQQMVTARLVTHGEGMAVEVTGFEESDLSKEQIKSLVQKARDKLLSAQFEYRDRDEVPPTEISIPLPNKEDFASEAPPEASSSASKIIKNLFDTTNIRQLHIFFLINQNLTWECLFISVFLPKLD